MTTRRPATKPRQPLGLTAADIRVGQNIGHDGHTWSVAAQHPDGGGMFWLHRYDENGNYRTAAVHVRNMTSLNKVK